MTVALCYLLLRKSSQVVSLGLSIDHAFNAQQCTERQGWREAHQVHPHLQAAVHLMAAVYTTMRRFYYVHTKTIVCFLSDGIQSYVADHVADHLSMKNVSNLD